MRNEASKVAPFPYPPYYDQQTSGGSMTHIGPLGSTHMGVTERQVHEELMQFKAAGDELFKEL